MLGDLFIEVYIYKWLKFIKGYEWCYVYTRSSVYPVLIFKYYQCRGCGWAVTMCPCTPSYTQLSHLVSCGFELGYGHVIDWVLVSLTLECVRVMMPIQDHSCNKRHMVNPDWVTCRVIEAMS
jgi:hypothetical protein